MAYSIGNGSPPAVFSQLTRRQLVQNGVLGAGALAVGSLGGLRAARALDDINFWATGTLDIGDDGWRTIANDSGVKVDFTDNGNDPGPVVAKLVAGNAIDIYDVGGLQGGSEKELARRGLIAPWDISQIPHYASVWQWAKDIPYLTHDGKVYGIPTVINADSMIAVRDKVGSVDSYGVIFDPKLKGKTAMEDAWINSVTFTAIYLKNSENAKIAEPGNLTADELGLVMEFLIKHKRDRQFRTFWNGWEQGLQLLASQEVWVMTGWEPILYAARKRGIDCYYAVPREGYEGWANNTVLLKSAVVRGRTKAAHQMVNALLAGFYGCKLGQLRGYVIPTDNSVAYATAHPNAFDPAAVRELTERVKQKFAGKVYWQNTRPDNFQLYETWWQKLRNA
ncbi:ABC transporter substrate-binding protein [Bradyrhizobium iriomotense]|uniref:ABC transporter substrate-binding protein n=1 Tax=Bradyrhizobium iriomotense TaxID=441950 RepID=UPI0024E16DF9|nr:extracellular solute-binding protein [Bradyrhizobium iriomotense]